MESGMLIPPALALPLSDQSCDAKYSGFPAPVLDRLSRHTVRVREAANIHRKVTATLLLSI
jgi:hypothetical protein